MQEEHLMPPPCRHQQSLMIPGEPVLTLLMALSFPGLHTETRINCHKDITFHSLNKPVWFQMLVELGMIKCNHDKGALSRLGFEKKKVGKERSLNPRDLE